MKQTRTALGTKRTFNSAAAFRCSAPRRGFATDYLKPGSQNGHGHAESRSRLPLAFGTVANVQSHRCRADFVADLPTLASTGQRKRDFRFSCHGRDFCECLTILLRLCKEHDSNFFNKVTRKKVSQHSLLSTLACSGEIEGLPKNVLFRSRRGFCAAPTFKLGGSQRQATTEQRLWVPRMLFLK